MKKKKLNIDLKEVVALYNKNITIDNIAKHFNCSTRAIRDRLIKNNIHTVTPSLNLNKNLPLEDFLYYYNQNLTIKEISHKLKISLTTITRYIKDHNLERDLVYRYTGVKKYSYDESYFEKINTPEKAYFLGLIYADGCNTRKGLSIVLAKEDGYILENFKEKIQYTGKLYFKKRCKEQYKDCLALNITSDKLSKQLIKLGVVPAKSLILTFPSEEIVAKELQSHFIRGYFDGDGCISGTYRKKVFYKTLSLVGTPEFLVGCQEILMQNCFLNTTKFYQAKYDKFQTQVMCYKGNIQIKRIQEYLYKDCNDLYLTRKRDKFKL